MAETKAEVKREIKRVDRSAHLQAGPAKGVPELKVAIGVVRHQDQRYPTVGDWYDEKDTLVIKVSRLADWRHSALIAIHELVEAVLCRQKGIPEADVLAFDLAFEKARVAGDTREPGDQKNAPYQRQHRFATLIEKMIADELGVRWPQYEAALEALETADALQHSEGGQPVLPVRENDGAEAGVPREQGGRGRAAAGR